jgi:hypothetical protein
MTTTLQYHDHAIERCDATTGHSAVTVALCRDTATARMLVDAYNSNERLQQRIDHEAVMATQYATEACALEARLADSKKREQVLREALTLLCNRVDDCIMPTGTVKMDVTYYVPKLRAIEQASADARSALAATEVKP